MILINHNYFISYYDLPYSFFSSEILLSCGRSIQSHILHNLEISGIFFRMSDLATVPSSAGKLFYHYLCQSRFGGTQK